MDQPGKVASPARGQLNRQGKLIFPCPRSCLRRQPVHLHTQAEYGAYLRDSSRVPRWRLFRVAKKMGTYFVFEMRPPFCMFSNRNWLTSKVPSGGMYTTACSSDVCNIPTNDHFFCIFTVSA